VVLIPELLLRLAARAPCGAERLIFAPVARSASMAALEAGQFLWVNADNDDRSELRIILEVGERCVLLAPLEHHHAAASSVCRPLQVRLAPGHYRLRVD